MSASCGKVSIFTVVPLTTALGRSGLLVTVRGGLLSVGHYTFTDRARSC